MNQEFAPSQKDVMKLLDNMTAPTFSFSPCQQNNSTSNNTKGNGTGRSDIKMCTDANGRAQKPETLNITQAPFIVKTCDQVLYIQGAKKLRDYDDCSSREPGFFTMSMFMVNYFLSDKPSTLQRSILIEHMNNLPSFVPGTGKKCINFSDGKTPAQFAICFDDAGITETLQYAFMNYMKCRMGDNLRPLSMPQLKRVYELTCGGQPIDPRLIFSNNKDDVINGINKNLKKSLNPYYQVKFPPGGVEEKKIDKNQQNLHGPRLH